MDIQTSLALLIVLAVAGRLIYKRMKKRQNKDSSPTCGCGKDDCS